jgi:hypothetical protein
MKLDDKRNIRIEMRFLECGNKMKIKERIGRHKKRKIVKLQ